MAVHTQPTLSLGMSARIAEAAALSPSSFRKRYRSSYETSSASSPSSLPIRKRYRGTLELVEDAEDESSDSSTEREGLEGEGHSSEDEGPGLEDECPSLEDEGLGTEEEEEDVVPEGQQHAVPVMDTTAYEPLGLGYGALRRRELVVGEGEMPNTFKVGQSSRSVPELKGAKRISAFRQPTLVTWIDAEDGRVYTNILTYVPPAAPVQTPPSPEWSFGSLLVSPPPAVVPSPIASQVTASAATISIDEDQFLQVGTQFELHGRILCDHTQRLDALPPTLFESYDRDLRELYTRLGERSVLALEAWAGQTDAQRAALWYAMYDIQRENHDLRRQIAEERREQLELTDRVARMEKRQESRGE
ncbi:hypothetical protein Tco_0167899 [Tanacetum coccineum]